MVMDLTSFLNSFCSYSVFFFFFCSVMSEFWKVDRGHDIALCSQISQDNHYCFLFLGKMSVWGKVLTNVGYPWCSPCQAEEDNRSLSLERTFTHRNLLWRGMLPAWGIYANGHCNEDGSSGSHYWCENRGFSMLWNCTVFWCLPGRNVTEGQIAHADSQCSQPSDSTHNTALHAICKTLTPVWALSSQNLLYFWKSPIYHQLPETLVWLQQ